MDNALFCWYMDTLINCLFFLTGVTVGVLLGKEVMKCF